MDPSADMLDIKPMTPASAGSVVPPAASGELESIRSRIAAIGETGSAEAQVIKPGESVSLRPEAAPVSPQIVPPPISPAAAAVAALPAQPRAKAGRVLPSPVKPILSAIGAFIFLLVIFKSQIIFSQLRYLTGKPTATTNVAPVATEVIPAAPTITIPKINVNAPVVYEPSIQEAAIMKGLENGVVHYGTTPVPGQPGNMVIVGHSSNDWWEPGNFKFVFVLLDKLVIGDQFSINYQSHRYVYEVTNAKVVAPTDLSVLAPTAVPSATLITCTPPGTSWKRLVIQAKQVSPAPGTTATTLDQTSPGDQTVQLPGNAPSFTDQLGEAWHNIVRGLGSLFGHSQSPTPTSTPSTNPQTLPGAN